MESGMTTRWATPPITERYARSFALLALLQS